MSSVAAPTRYPASRFETQAWVDLRDPTEQARLTPAAVRGIRRLADAWGLTVPQVCALLGEVVTVEHVQGGVDPQQVGRPGESIDTQGLRRRPGPGVPGAGRDVAE